MKDPGGLVGGLVAFTLIVGVLFAVGLWYLVIFGLAVVVFVILWLVSRKQEGTTRNLLRFRPGQVIPAEVWQRTQGMAPAAGSNVVNLTIVGLDDHADNWAKFAEIAEVDRAGDVSVRIFAIAYSTPTADRGIVFAYDRLILGHLRAIELDDYFDPVWSRGGILQIAMTAKFDASGRVLGATAYLPIFVDDGGIFPARERAAWRALRGKNRE